MANNVCLALGAEKLMGIEITERCTVLRVIACEMSRIISHLVWLGTTGIDLGAFTPFLWSFQQREEIYNLQEQWTGARLTTSLTRVGGMMADVPDGFEAGFGVLHNFTRPRRVGYPVHTETRSGAAAPGVGTIGPSGDQLPLRPDAPRQRRGLDVARTALPDYDSYISTSDREKGEIYAATVGSRCPVQRILEQALDRWPTQGRPDQRERPR